MFARERAGEEPVLSGTRVTRRPSFSNSRSHVSCLRATSVVIVLPIYFMTSFWRFDIFAISVVGRIV